MMLPSHLAATVLAALVLSAVWPMSERSWLLALAFGVAIDADHLLAIPRYLMEHGLSGALDLRAGLGWGSNWQGFMHTPWALLVVVPAMLWFQSAIPLAFWGLHMVLDFVVAKHYVVFGSPTEWAICALMVLAIGGLVVLQHRLPVASPGALGLLAAPWRRGR